MRHEEREPIAETRLENGTIPLSNNEQCYNVVVFFYKDIKSITISESFNFEKTLYVENLTQETPIVFIFKNHEIISF